MKHASRVNFLSRKVQLSCFILFLLAVAFGVVIALSGINASAKENALDQSSAQAQKDVKVDKSDASAKTATKAAETQMPVKEKNSNSTNVEPDSKLM